MTSMIMLLRYFQAKYIIDSVVKAVFPFYSHSSVVNICSVLNNQYAIINIELNYII